MALSSALSSGGGDRIVITIDRAPEPGHSHYARAAKLQSDGESHIN
jgi:hypothetical protein